MLNGIATRPFVRSRENAQSLAASVGSLFLYGFLERSRVPSGVSESLGAGATAV